VTSSAPPPLRLGVVGCGRVFERFHLPAIVRIPTIELVAACDPDPSRLRWATHQTHYATAAELLNHPGLDAILILTPPAHHAEAAVRALDSGLHVLVEKPMALNRAEGRRMVQAAHRAGRRLQVGFSRRYREPYRCLRAALQGVDRSQLRTARFELSFPTSSWGAHTDFLGNEAQGGGVFDDVLSHQVDLIGWLLGTPNEVRAETDPSAEAIVSADLRLDSLTVSCRAAHGGYAEWLQVELNDGVVLEASGSRFRVGRRDAPVWRHHAALVLDRVALLGSRLRRRPNVSLASFERQLWDFERAVRGGESDGATGENGLSALEIVEECRASARQGGVWRDPRNPKPAG
jgi:predicted dehydrogenase